MKCGTDRVPSSGISGISTSTRFVIEFEAHMLPTMGSKATARERWAFLYRREIDVEPSQSRTGTRPRRRPRWAFVLIASRQCRKHGWRSAGAETPTPARPILAPLATLRWRVVRSRHLPTHDPSNRVHGRGRAVSGCGVSGHRTPGECGGPARQYARGGPVEWSGNRPVHHLGVRSAGTARRGPECQGTSNRPGVAANLASRSAAFRSRAVSFLGLGSGGGANGRAR